MPRESVSRAYSIRKRLYVPFPRNAFKHIHRFIRLDCADHPDATISILGDMIITYKRKADFRETTVALTDSRVNVTIKVFGHYRFDGYVLSVDEFKLIWERIL